jgi:NAD(P)-dependent dehydrogenase (short-subunit alcohol dehydrogenase family)
VTEAVRGCEVVALVHAAAIEGIVSLADSDRETFDRLIGTNLAGPFFLTRALQPVLGEGSAVVFVGSVSAQRGRDRHAAYAASKAGLLGLTASLAVELAPRVRVNCVSPGATDTAMFAQAVSDYLGPLNDAEIKSLVTAEQARLLLGRVAQPAEIASSIVHFALDATYSTGAVITCDGGYSAR